MFRFALAFVILSAGYAQAQQDADSPMTLRRMAEIVFTLDADAENNGPAFRFVIDDTVVVLVTDEAADRMRAMVPIRSANDLSPTDLRRMMQANFDAALDARYAIADGQLWSVFIHPFRALEKDQLISGLAQTVNAAKTYGGLYTGGAQQFGQGDSAPLQRQLIDELLKRGEEI